MAMWMALVAVFIGAVIMFGAAMMAAKKKRDGK